MVKVIHIVGARPQFIKLSPLYNCMRKNNFKQIILHTGQHYDQNMSNIFFSKFNIPKPDFNLNINQLKHGAMTGKMIEMIENEEAGACYMYYNKFKNSMTQVMTRRKILPASNTANAKESTEGI